MMYPIYSFPYLCPVRTVLITAPKTVQGSVGNTYNFTALATSDPNTPVTYSWFLKTDKQQEEQQIVTTSDSKFVISTDGGSLTVNNADASTFGNYRVVASNGISQESAVFILIAPIGEFLEPSSPTVVECC